jgi:hypothetical protein
MKPMPSRSALVFLLMLFAGWADGQQRMVID